ncbi:MAG: PqiC family protein [Kofleriaceae bacterium]
MLILAMVACRSAGSSYYTLLPPATDDSSPATNELQLDVLPVDVPADVDRAEIVVRTSAGEVTPVQTRSWIAPLALEIRHAFSDDLTHALGARDIAGLTPADGVPTFRIKLSVQRFESLIGKRAMIEAISTIRASTGPALVCSHRASEEAGAGYAALAEAHQRALVTIAKQVADGVRSMRAGTGSCATK